MRVSFCFRSQGTGIDLGISRHEGKTFVKVAFKERAVLLATIGEDGLVGIRSR